MEGMWLKCGMANIGVWFISKLPFQDLVIAAAGWDWEVGGGGRAEGGPARATNSRTGNGVIIILLESWKLLKGI